MRIKDMITQHESNWYFNKVSPLLLWKCIGITNENLNFDTRVSRVKFCKCAMSTTLVYWLTFLGTCRLFSDIYAFNCLWNWWRKLGIVFFSWNGFFLPRRRGPFSLYVQDEVNRAQGFAVNYQQLVKKKPQHPCFFTFWWLLQRFSPEGPFGSS